MLIDFCLTPITVAFDLVPHLIVARTFSNRHSTGLWSRLKDKGLGESGKELKPHVVLQTKQSGLSLQETVIPVPPVPFRWDSPPEKKVVILPNPWEAPIFSVDKVTHRPRTWRAGIQLYLKQASEQEKRWQIVVHDLQADHALVCLSVNDDCLRAIAIDDELPLHKHMQAQYRSVPTVWDHLLFDPDD